MIFHYMVSSPTVKNLAAAATSIVSIGEDRASRRRDGGPTGTPMMPLRRRGTWVPKTANACCGGRHTGGSGSIPLRLPMASVVVFFVDSDRRHRQLPRCGPLSRHGRLR